jgi:hypothetical protein
MREVKMRPPARRRIFRCAFSDETGIGRLKGWRVNAMDDRVLVHGSDAGVHGACDVGESAEVQAG